MKLLLMALIVFINNLGMAQGTIVILDEKNNSNSNHKTTVVDNQAQSSSKLSNDSNTKNALYSKGFGLGVGYNKSLWNHFDDDLENKGVIFEVSFFKKDRENLDTYLSFSSSQHQPKEEEMIYYYNFGLGKKYFAGDDGLALSFGGDLQFGTYKIWKTIEDTQNVISYKKVSSGFLLGLNPRLGLRIRITENYFFNAEGLYTAYLDYPQSKLGRWSILLSFTHVKF